jgi:hypothetical protein
LSRFVGGTFHIVYKMQFLDASRSSALGGRSSTSSSFGDSLDARRLPGSSPSNWKN